MALVQLSVVEQRLDAVRAVLAGAQVIEVAACVRGVSVSQFMRWLASVSGRGCCRVWRIGRIGPGRVRSRSAGAVEVRVAEMRRQHPRWGAKRIRMELLSKPPEGVGDPGRRPDDEPDPGPAGPGDTSGSGNVRGSRIERWERPGPMQLWQLDIVGGVMLVDPVTGVLREAKVVTGVDDHTRFCVIASVVRVGDRAGGLFGVGRGAVPVRGAGGDFD